MTLDETIKKVTALEIKAGLVAGYYRENEWHSLYIEWAKVARRYAAARRKLEALRDRKTT